MLVYKAGFVALLGRPNVGKSTLLNALLGRKIAITTPKPQTTRNRIMGVIHRPDAQLVLVDTPGVHKALHKLGERMNKTSRSASRDVDLIWHLVDVSRPPSEEDQWVAGLCRSAAIPAWLLANKCDLVQNLAGRVEPYLALAPYARHFVVSAFYEQGLDPLRDAVFDVLPEGSPYFPEEMVTDQSEDFYVSEIIREKILDATRDEVPYAVAVMVDERVARSSRLTFIRATAYVERDTQKAIVIGSGGRMLKAIGQAARAELEAYYGHQVFLDLWVKVRPRWRNEDEWLRRLGFREPGRS
ncbi:MAG: GTPase Era [Thermaerobacter sp.]|nr:GTPase Era [Thermaerobacter sp.]